MKFTEADAKVLQGRLTALQRGKRVQKNNVKLEGGGFMNISVGAKFDGGRQIAYIKIYMPRDEKTD